MAHERSDQPAPPPSNRTRLRREPQKGAYDRATIDSILDAGLICHLAFVHDGQPYTIPTLHARVGDSVFVHGSSASRALKTLKRGAPACLTVTLVDGIVLARSAFEHSMNFRSVMLLGDLVPMEVSSEKLEALRAFTNKLVPGRWEEARQPTPKELTATAVLKLPIDEASAKVRTGPPSDGESEDASLPIWAGVLPIETRWGRPEPDPTLKHNLAIPPSIRSLLGPEPRP